MCHEVALEFFTTKAPDPPHWTLNSCFGAFHTIWVNLEPLGCLTKLGAKRVELVQKIVLRSRVRIFRNKQTRSTPLDPKLVQKFVPRRCVGVFLDERTRSTPLDPKHMLWCISYHLHAFGTVRLPYETRGKMFRISVKVHATKSRWSFSRQTHPIHPIGP